MTTWQSRFARLYQRLRILKFRLLSDCRNVQGTPHIRQPVQLLGAGAIRFNGTVPLGWYPSPYFFTGCIYVEARSPLAVIQLEDGVCINNNSVLLSDGAGIFIGK